MIESVIIAVAETSTVVKTSGFPWDKSIPVICVVIGAVLGFFLNFFYDLIKAWLANRKEKCRFKKIKKEIPDIIKVVKKGLKKSPLQTLLIKQTKKVTTTKGRVNSREIHELCFGKERIDFSKELWSNYFDYINCLHDRGLGRKDERANAIIFTPEFLDQIEKWG